MRPIAPLVVAFLVIAVGWLGLQRAQESERVVEAARPTTVGQIEAHGAKSPLRVLRDGRGVPHVFARSEEDAYFGLGFVHAQDRLGQMLSLWLAARGRSAEVLGPEALPADRLARVVDIGGLADRATGRLEAKTHRRLRAYAAGVNARLDRVRAGQAAPPAQFTADSLPLDRWEPADSMAVLKAWAWGLGASVEPSLVLADLIRHLGPDAARIFVPAGAGASGMSGDRPAVASLGAGFRDPLRAALGLRATGLGSSAWVLAGSASDSGKPLLAGDAHFETTVPAHFHHAHVRGGDLDVAGAALPGVPLFWSGANRGVAWSATAARASVVDLFVESLKPATERRPGRFHDGKRWRDLELREERIEVAGQAPETLTVRSTRHGPLLNPLFSQEREPLALAWSGAQPGEGITSMMEAAKARDGDGFLAALAEHHEPALVFAWADAGGAGGTKVAGWIPRRALPSGLVPVNGRSAWADWQDPVPAARLPEARLGRDRPYVIAADGPLETGPARQVEWLWRSGERTRLIEAGLARAAEEGHISLRRMTELQAEVTSGRADAILTPVLALAGSPAQLAAEEREILAVLEAWDRRSNTGSIGAAVYHVFVNELAQALFTPVLGEALYQRWTALEYAAPEAMLERVLTDLGGREGAPAAWSHGNLIDAVRRTFRSTWLRFGVAVGPNREKWSWGRLHTLQFRPFGVLRWPVAPERALGPHAFPGGRLSIAVGGYDWGQPFAVTTAATHRMAVDVAELDKLLVSLAPGQVEQVEHPHRADGVAPWLAGEPGLLLTSAVLLEEQAVARLEILPVPKP